MHDGIWMAGLLAVGAALNVVGVALLKLAALGGVVAPAILGALCWGASAVVFVELLKLKQPVAVLGPMLSGAGFLALVVIGAVFWGEHLSLRQFGALALLIVAMLLFSLPGAE